jgi:hypothetical protein
MSFLRKVELRLEGLVEGAFSRAFKARVQPVELARQLAKEMDSYKTVSVSRTYVPNEYTVYLSRDDRRQFRDYEEALLDELWSDSDRPDWDEIELRGGRADPRNSLGR